MNKYILEVCKIGQLAACCKYLGCGTEGMECLKANPVFKATVDENWAKTQHVAQGDNCPGQQDLKTAKIEQANK